MQAPKLINLFRLTMRTSEMYARHKVPRDYVHTLGSYLCYKTAPLDNVVGNWTKMYEVNEKDKRANRIVNQMVAARQEPCNVSNVLLLALLCGYNREYGRDNIPFWAQYENPYMHIHVPDVESISDLIPETLYEDVSNELVLLCGYKS